MNAVTLSKDQTRARLDEIRERLARVRADRWSHVFETDEPERIVVTRAVMDRDGRKAGEEAPAVLVSFGPDVSWWEAEFIREAREDLAFVLELLTDAGRTIRELRSSSRGAPHPSDAGPPEGRETVRGAQSHASPAADGVAAPKNLAAEASIKCTEPAFQRFLSERHATGDDGDLSDSALAAAVLRRALKIGSRKDMNTDPDAAGRWRDMRAEFGEWMRT